MMQLEESRRKAFLDGLDTAQGILKSGIDLLEQQGLKRARRYMRGYVPWEERAWHWVSRVWEILRRIPKNATKTLKGLFR